MAYHAETKYATLGTSVDRDSKASWTNPTYIYANNGAAQTTPGPDTYSDLLFATRFGFAIPSSAIITGIKATFIRYANSNIGIKDDVLQLCKTWSTVGDNKAISSYWPVASDSLSYGDETDLWGTTWSPEDVNDITFGVALSIHRTAGFATTGYVDYISITIYWADYTEIGAILSYILDHVSGVGGISSHLFELTSAVGNMGVFLLEPTFRSGGIRTFPVPNPKTVWQSQSGKRTFPLPGEQVVEP